MSLAAAAVATIWCLQLVLSGISALLALAMGQIAAMALVWLYAARRAAPGALGVRRAPWRFFVGAALIGVSAWYASWLFVSWLNPPDQSKHLEEVVEQSPLVPTLLAIAVLPAIGEELVFRGVLTRGLATVLRPLAAIVFSAIAFAAYHVIPVQMLGVLPLALALGFVALRAHSVLPTMLMHAANNATVVLFARKQLPGMRSMHDHPYAWLAIACAMTAGGLALSAKEAS